MLLDIVLDMAKPVRMTVFTIFIFKQLTHHI